MGIAFDIQNPIIRFINPGQNTQQRRFSRPIMPNEADPFSFRNREADPRKSLDFHDLGGIAAHPHPPTNRFRLSGHSASGTGQQGLFQGAGTAVEYGERQG